MTDSDIDCIRGALDHVENARILVDNLLDSDKGFNPSWTTWLRVRELSLMQVFTEFQEALMLAEQNRWREIGAGYLDNLYSIYDKMDNPYKLDLQQQALVNVFNAEAACRMAVFQSKLLEDKLKEGPITQQVLANALGHLSNKIKADLVPELSDDLYDQILTKVGEWVSKSKNVGFFRPTLNRRTRVKHRFRGLDSAKGKKLSVLPAVTRRQSQKGYAQGQGVAKKPPPVVPSYYETQNPGRKRVRFNVDDAERTQYYNARGDYDTVDCGEERERGPLTEQQLLKAAKDRGLHFSEDPSMQDLISSLELKIFGTISSDCDQQQRLHHLSQYV